MGSRRGNVEQPRGWDEPAESASTGPVEPAERGDAWSERQPFPCQQVPGHAPASDMTRKPKPMSQYVAASASASPLPARADPIRRSGDPFRDSYAGDADLSRRRTLETLTLPQDLQR